MNAEENEQAGLAELRARMSSKQRQEMADIIKKEMERRGMTTSAAKSQVKNSSMSGGLKGDQVGELYRDVGQAVQKLRVQKLEKQLAAAKGQAKVASFGMKKSFLPARTERSSEPSEGGDTLGKSFLLYGVIALGLLKVLMMTGAIGGDSKTAEPTAIASEDRAAQTASANPEVQPATIVEDQHLPASAPGTWTQAEKELLTQLDARRVELEKRKEALDRRESDLKNQAQVLTERLAELRGLTAKLAEARKEKDARRESRLEQLANVYSVMEPNEAGALIAKLDDTISLELLQRMPEKRMGQILGFMDKERAVDLTRLLTSRRD